jgi:hypothetical protein
MQNYNIIDRAALAASSALMLLGIVVLGIVEVVAGPPYGAAPTTNDAGEVIATPMVDPNIRTGLVIAGLLVLFVWGLYRMAAIRVEEADTQRSAVTAD